MPAKIRKHEIRPVTEKEAKNWSCSSRCSGKADFIASEFRATRNPGEWERRDRGLCQKHADIWSAKMASLG